MLIKHKTQVLANFDRILQYPVNYLSNATQRLDELGFRLSGALPNLLKQKTIALEYCNYSRFSLTKILNYKCLQLESLTNNLLHRKKNLFNQFEYKLSINSSLLSSLDYNNVLKRGYAMLKDHNDNYISTVAEVKSSKHITVKLKDGNVRLLG